ncbi:MAG: hypothetical protein ABIR17_01870 [Pseudolysinimonas sp.]|uniref:hypothetical protein n=1 Tax=Pseudolysinimonas sp. TaxID=2680009 RepID=UPI0032634F1C
MTLRRAAGNSRLVLMPAALAVLLLGGCTSNFLVGGGGSPSTDAPPPSPSATETATPTPTSPPQQTSAECNNLLINRAGTYALGDCTTVTIEGSNIDVSFGSIENLVIRGNGARLSGEHLGDVQLSGQGDEIDVVTLGTLHIRGDQNLVNAEQTIHSVIIDGNTNTVTAGDGIDQKADNGIGNQFS